MSRSLYQLEGQQLRLVLRDLHIARKDLWSGAMHSNHHKADLRLEAAVKLIEDWLEAGPSAQDKED
jgi:hypothetical protein